jgi:hypothetical protein
MRLKLYEDKLNENLAQSLSNMGNTYLLNILNDSFKVFTITKFSFRMNLNKRALVLPEQANTKSRSNIIKNVMK